VRGDVTGIVPAGGGCEGITGLGQGPGRVKEKGLKGGNRGEGEGRCPGNTTMFLCSIGGVCEGLYRSRHARRGGGGCELHAREFPGGFFQAWCKRAPPHTESARHAGSVQSFNVFVGHHIQTCATCCLCVRVCVVLPSQVSKQAEVLRLEQQLEALLAAAPASLAAQFLAGSSSSMTDAPAAAGPAADDPGLARQQADTGNRRPAAAAAAAHRSSSSSSGGGGGGGLRPGAVLSRRLTYSRGPYSSTASLAARRSRYSPAARHGLTSSGSIRVALVRLGRGSRAARGRTAAAAAAAAHRQPHKHHHHHTVHGGVNDHQDHVQGHFCSSCGGIIQQQGHGSIRAEPSGNSSSSSSVDGADVASRQTCDDGSSSEHHSCSREEEEEDAAFQHQQQQLAVNVAALAAAVTSSLHAVDALSAAMRDARWQRLGRLKAEAAADALRASAARLKARLKTVRAEAASSKAAAEKGAAAAAELPRVQSELSAAEARLRALRTEQQRQQQQQRSALAALAATATAAVGGSSGEAAAVLSAAAAAAVAASNSSNSSGTSKGVVGGPECGPDYVRVLQLLHQQLVELVSGREGLTAKLAESKATIDRKNTLIKCVKSWQFYTQGSGFRGKT